MGFILRDLFPQRINSTYSAASNISTYHKSDSSKERWEEAGVNCNRGNAHASLEDIKTNIEDYERRLKIAQELRDRSGEAYRNLANAYYILGDFQTAIDYLHRDLKIAKQMCDRWGEKRAFQNLGMIAGQNLGDFKTTLNYNERFQKIAKELGDGLGEGEACRQLGIAHHSLGNFQIAINYHHG